MPDTEPQTELEAPPMVAYVFESVNPVLLGIDPETWIPTLEVNVARAILALAAVDMAKVVLVVSGDMVTSIRERLPEHQRDAFSDERGAGTLGGKTMCVGDEVHVLMPFWLYAETEAAAAMMPEDEAEEFRAGAGARIALARRTVVHEAQHVLMTQKGEAGFDITDSARARRDFLFLAHDVIDEYRAELGVAADLRAAFEYEVAAETLPAFREGLRREVTAYERHRNVETLMYGVLAQAQHAWKALANVAAARRVGAVYEQISASGTDWSRLAAPYWARFEALLSSAPAPAEHFEPEAQRQLMASVADLFDEWIQELGFLWRDIDGGRNAEFLITSRHIVG
ncbi:hypothetical protein LG315_08335 [Microbacterium marinum]|uniref:hypothetical protein n=1 Tax=Microbacterium marinum TaxID=421115 RepID=UPI00384C07A3